MNFEIITLSLFGDWSKDRPFDPVFESIIKGTV